MSVSTSEDEGVMGYQVTTVTPPNIAPRAAAAFPSMMIFPRLASIRRISNGSCFCSDALAYSWPARAAFTFSSAALAFFRNCLPIAASTSGISRPSSWATTPT